MSTKSRRLKAQRRALRRWGKIMGKGLVELFDAEDRFWKHFMSHIRPVSSDKLDGVVLLQPIHYPEEWNGF